MKHIKLLVAVIHFVPESIRRNVLTCNVILNKSVYLPVTRICLVYATDGRYVSLSLATVD